MANRPAKAGATGAGPDWGLTGLAGAPAPSPVHHQGYPGAQNAPHDPQLAHDPRSPRSARDPRGHGDRKNPALSVLAWLSCLIPLAGVAIGLAAAWYGSRFAVRGTVLVGGALLVAAVARLLLPSRYAGPLSSRGKASDVAGFAVFGTAVLVVALMLS
jgi:Protein of unknown function (DUF3017)